MLNAFYSSRLRNNAARYAVRHAVTCDSATSYGFSSASRLLGTGQPPTRSSHTSSAPRARIHTQGHAAATPLWWLPQVLLTQFVAPTNVPSAHTNNLLFDLLFDLFDLLFDPFRTNERAATHDPSATTKARHSDSSQRSAGSGDSAEGNLPAENPFQHGDREEDDVDREWNAEA